MKITNDFASNGIFLDRTQTEEFLSDIKDAVLYEITLIANSGFEEAFLVIGNTKHFPLKPCVVTPGEMVKILEKKGL